MGPSSRLCASLDVELSPLCARNKMPGPPFEVIKEHTTSHSKHHESKHTKQTQITVSGSSDHFNGTTLQINQRDWLSLN